MKNEARLHALDVEQLAADQLPEACGVEVEGLKGARSLESPHGLARRARTPQPELRPLARRAVRTVPRKINANKSHTQ